MRKIRQFILLVTDLIIVYISVLLSLCIRFDGRIPIYYFSMALVHGIYISAIMVTVLYIFELYKSLWEYAGIKELVMILLACFSGTIISVMVELLLSERLPLSILITAGILITVLVGGVRISFRLIRRFNQAMCVNWHRRHCDKKRVMVVGAGDGGSRIIREIANNPSMKCKLVIAVDDDKNKHGRKILGIPIVGDTQTIQRNAIKYNIDEIIFAIPTAGVNDKKRILEDCMATACNVQVMPSVSKLFLNGRLSNCLLRPAMIKDLLGREEVELNIPSIAGYLKNKTVLITGGGGSIGSEIARQVIVFQIKKLIILDIYENSAYDLLKDLKFKYGDEVEIDIIIASIRDTIRLEKIFLMTKPDVVFHAAAYKHVPLMEKHPGEAINNNVLGTLNLVKLADKYCIEKFILISTDKAVNPVNIMGATKRVAEMIIQSFNKYSNTEYMAVRFGNVLGSNGSVIPIFKKQIEAGGPVTVTHPDIERYFMTICEASQLVIQAGALANGGEIFVLDMGEPIKIIDLAINMIRMSGLIPNVDIKIKIVGLRPGEKMFEELLLDHTGKKKTTHNKIFVEQPCEISYEEIISNIELLTKCTEDPDMVREVIFRIVSTYQFKQETPLELCN